MELFRIIKKDARKALHSCGGRTVAAAMILALAYLAVNITETIFLYIFCGDAAFIDYTAPGNYAALLKSSTEAVIITAAATFLYFILILPLFWGYKKLTFAFAEGKDENITTLFDMFSSGKNYFSSVAFTFMYFIRRLFAVAVSAAPGAGFLYCTVNFIPEGSATLGILRIGAIIVSCSVIAVGLYAGFVFIQRWHLAPYYFVSGSGICKSFGLSAKASKGICGDILRFKLSFIGWALLSFFVLPMLYSVPYYFVSLAIHAKYLMEKYEHSLAQVPENLEHEENESTAEENIDGENA